MSAQEKMETFAYHLLPEQSKLVEDYLLQGKRWLSIGTPWFTNDSISWLEANVRASDTVFEFGGGRSTMWWASRVASVTTLETSPHWVTLMMLHLYSHPYLLRKVRLLHVPADWHPNWKNGRKEYWTRNETSISIGDIFSLEIDYLKCAERNSNASILCMDGGIRGYNMVLFAEKKLLEGYEIIVVDNTESRFHSMYFEKFLGNKFERLDFVTGSLRQFKSNPAKKHVTTVFVRSDRAKQCVEVQTETKSRWTMDDLCQHQDFIYDIKSKRIVDNYAKSIYVKLTEYGFF